MLFKHIEECSLWPTTPRWIRIQTLFFFFYKYSSSYSVHITTPLRPVTKLPAWAQHRSTHHCGKTCAETFLPAGSYRLISTSNSPCHGSWWTASDSGQRTFKPSFLSNSGWIYYSQLYLQAISVFWYWRRKAVCWSDLSLLLSMNSDQYSPFPLLGPAIHRDGIALALT